jgi:4-hydroxybenzoate polyprenyltransferase
MMASAALLGVAAHLLNALPDFATDAATGVRGLPHMLGSTLTRAIATTLLVVASAVAVLGPFGDPGRWGWGGLAVVAVLAAVGATGRGKAPFAAAVGIALVDVLLLTLGAS